jgi:hypothetical protein
LRQIATAVAADDLIQDQINLAVKEVAVLCLIDIRQIKMVHKLIVEPQVKFAQRWTA